jgi:two-component system chemotaxis response regulator CheV
LHCAFKGGYQIAIIVLVGNGLAHVFKRPRHIINDIEMPEMDGHRLTKLVKSDDATKDIPIIIFSSLVNDDMKRKGEALGADAQLSKPEIGNLVRIVDELVAEKHLDR